jgi:hypothetical protein
MTLLDHLDEIREECSRMLRATSGDKRFNGSLLRLGVTEPVRNDIMYGEGAIGCSVLVSGEEVGMLISTTNGKGVLFWRRPS